MPHPSLPFRAATAAALLLPAPALGQQAPGAGPVASQVDTALRGVLLVAGVLVVLILVAVAVLVYRRVLARGVPDAPAGAAPAPGRPAGPGGLAEAAREEARGNHAAAAQRYEAAGERIRAGECWEKAKDFTRAAECFEAGGALERAALLHVRTGGSLRAAGIYMRTRNYIEAAKIFRNKGDHLRAAQALELFGNKVAAARSYAEAGNHARAARLLEEEGLYGEAAATYGRVVGDGPPTPASADRWTTYAALLAVAGERDRAEEAYRQVLAAVPGHLRADSGLRALRTRPAPAAAPSRPAAAPSAPPAPPPGPAAPPRDAGVAPAEIARAMAEEEGPQGDPLQRSFSLRSMIRAGRMEPRYGMRLWVQIMRVLDERHRANRASGRLSPDSILIDMENNVRIEDPAAGPTEYAAPEVQAGLAPDRQADIYSMGMILFELVTGSLADFGRRRASEVCSDVPGWLDELVARCTEKELTRRYRSTEEISQALLRLKAGS